MNSELDRRIADAKVDLDSTSFTAFDRPAKQAILVSLLAEKANQERKISFWNHPLMRTILYVVGVVVAAWLLAIFGLKK